MLFDILEIVFLAIVISFSAAVAIWAVGSLVLCAIAAVMFLIGIPRMEIKNRRWCGHCKRITFSKIDNIEGSEVRGGLRRITNRATLCCKRCRRDHHDTPSVRL